MWPGRSTTHRSCTVRWRDRGTGPRSVPGRVVPAHGGRRVRERRQSRRTATVAAGPASTVRSHTPAQTGRNAPSPSPPPGCPLGLPIPGRQPVRRCAQAVPPCPFPSPTAPNRWPSARTPRTPAIPPSIPSPPLETRSAAPAQAIAGQPRPAPAAAASRGDSPRDPAPPHPYPPPAADPSGSQWLSRPVHPGRPDRLTAPPDSSPTPDVRRAGAGLSPGDGHRRGPPSPPAARVRPPSPPPPRLGHRPLRI